MKTRITISLDSELVKIITKYAPPQMRSQFIERLLRHVFQIEKDDFFEKWLKRSPFKESK